MSMLKKPLNTAVFINDVMDSNWEQQFHTIQQLLVNFCAAREHIIINLICPVSISSQLKAEPDIKLSSQIFTLSFKLHTTLCTLCLTLHAFFVYMQNGEGSFNTVTRS